MHILATFTAFLGFISMPEPGFESATSLQLLNCLTRSDTNCLLNSVNEALRVYLFIEYITFAVINNFKQQL